jgi:UDP-N-acetyl-2-amino-2-deoxyglucuronate dehydrogenase
MERKIRFAILGCGGISKAHFTAIERTEEAELAAVCDMSEERAQACAHEYGVKYFTDYAEMLKQEDIDAICICTPSGMHPDQTIQAAKAGKHVVCEKPLAIKIEDLDRMIDVCQEENVKLAAIFPRRMSPAAQFAKSIIDQGHLGKLSLCSAYVKFYRQQAYYDSAGWRGTWEMDGGGAMMNQGIHTIDQLQWLVGPVSSIVGQAKAVLRNIEVEDTAVASLQFKNGALGVLEVTTTAYKQPGHQIIIHGDKGTMIIVEDSITKLDIAGEQVEIPTFEPFQVVPDGHAAQIKDMARAILDGHEPVVPGTESRPSLEIILGTYQSSREDKRVSL